MTLKANELLKKPIRLAPQYREYVWGGSRLIPGKSPVAEAWVLHENNSIIAPLALAGQTLAELVHSYGIDLVGRRAEHTIGQGFPLLIKLLDCAEWLSLQVHPDDELARKLEGPGARGKSEAWYFIDAAPGAEILCGVKPTTTSESFDSHLGSGSLLEITRRVPVHAGDSIAIPAGTLHALGPGLFVYEVQQTSDITYRTFDWNRPATAQRPLHTEQSRAAVKLDLAPNPLAHSHDPDQQRSVLVSNDFFMLEFLQSSVRPILLDAAGESFHALTVTHGAIHLQGNGWVEILNEMETILLPAALGAYQLTPVAPFEALLSYLP